MLIGVFFGNSRILMIAVLALGVLLSWLVAIRRRDGRMNSVPRGVNLLAASSALVSTAHGVLAVLPNISLSDLHASVLLLVEAFLLIGATVWGIARCRLWGIPCAFGTYCVGVVLSSFVFSLVVMVPTVIGYALSILGAIVVLLGLSASGSSNYKRGHVVRVYDTSGIHLGYYDENGNVRDQSGCIMLYKSGLGYFDRGGDSYDFNQNGDFVSRR